MLVSVCQQKITFLIITLSMTYRNHRVMQSTETSLHAVMLLLLPLLEHPLLLLGELDSHLHLRPFEYTSA
jgi:hypothetical protein